MSGPRRNTKWRHGLSRFNPPALNGLVEPIDGLFPLRAILDLTVGEEIVFYLRDQTPFMNDLCRVHPFRLMLKTGVARNEFGPLAFLLFWVANPQDPSNDIVAYDLYLNPHNEAHVLLWRELAAQTHWHLLMIGKDGEQRNFFELENTYGLDDALDFMLEACSPIPLIDFDRAKEEFMAKHSLEFILRQPTNFTEEAKEPLAATIATNTNPFSSPRYQSLFRTSMQRHLRETYLSVEDYLDQKRADLAHQLAGKTLIYLDTCHWVKLRQVMLQHTKPQPAYERILKRLERLRHRERICCPLSQPLFEELMKQTDPASRAATANLMDVVSGGVCVQIWIDLIRLEWRQHVARILLGRAEAEAPVLGFTKAGFWAGEHLIGQVPLPDCPPSVGRKLYLDMRWALSFHDYQALPDFIRTPDSMADAFVAAAAAKREQALEKRSRFSDLVQEERIALVNSMKDDFFAILEQMCPPTDSAVQLNVSTLMRHLVDEPTPWNMPSLQIVAGAGAAMTAKGQKAKPHDLLDIIHAAVAIPYCDAYFCDNPMAALLRSKPLEYHLAYNTTILSQPDEIAAFLETMV